MFEKMIERLQRWDFRIRHRGLRKTLGYIFFRAMGFLVKAIVLGGFLFAATIGAILLVGEIIETEFYLSHPIACTAISIWVLALCLLPIFSSSEY